MKNIGGILLNFSLFIGCFMTCSTSNTPKVQVHSGEIAGGFEYTYNGRKIYSFLGIPYASPPIQNNRFKEPQPVQPWLGVWNATVPGSACLGIDFGSILSDTKFIGQEDCLFLNVYTTKVIYKYNMYISLQSQVLIFLVGRGVEEYHNFTLFIIVRCNYFLHTSMTHDALSEAVINRQIVSNSLKRKGTQELYERPAKLMHRHLKESIDFSVKSTLTITDIRYIKNNLYRARSEQLPKLPTNILTVHSALNAIDCITNENEPLRAKMNSELQTRCRNINKNLPLLVDYNYTISNESLRIKIAQDIKQFYFGDKPISKETKSNLAQMISDRSFVYGTSKAAQHITAKNTAPVYFYEFGYSGNYSYTAFFDPKSYNRGSSSTHGDETSYVLKVDGFSVYDNEEDKKMIKTMVNIWATFIKVGVPDTENSEIWLPVSKNQADPFRFNKITQQQTFEAREKSNHGNYEFWSSLPLNEFFEFNVPEDIKTEL
ncbi:esterase E4-like [Myzus persicae]|uniref:esterase E4-like n=1 Tax=Myzus persicae TaxID=13164 RepID=UPI000B936675|nr:esterase E4-like [Myzus persicae]